LSLIKLFNSSKKTLKIYEHKWIKEGEAINIVGEPYCGKTTTCFYIIKNNSIKNVIYIASETLDKNYKHVLHKICNSIYLLNMFDLRRINEIIEQMPIELVVIDSLTALRDMKSLKDLEKLFTIIQEKRINIIVVSQVRGFDDKIFYENKKILDFFSFRLNVEKQEDCFVLEKIIKIRYDEIWRK
jgi:ABC-type dipeptide/oligopeptide/nickel transport system ATPase component